MNYWLAWILSLMHIALTAWLGSSAGALLAALKQSDIGAGLVLVIGGAVIIAGARLTGATLLSGLAHLARLAGPALASRCATAAVALSPARFRQAVAASCAGLILTGSGFATAAAAAPVDASPGWPTQDAGPSAAAPSSPGWPTSTQEPSPSAPPTSPGWPTSQPTHQPEKSRQPEASASPTTEPEDTSEDAPTSPPPRERHNDDDSASDADTPADDQPESSDAPDSAASTVTVSAGDSLWSIASEHYGTDDATQLGIRVDALYHANRPVIGADPNLIMPGQRLEMP